MQVILTHENADFDAIASLVGAHKLYPNAQPVLPRRVNRNVRAYLSLYGANLPLVEPETLRRGSHIQRVILVDTQSMTTVRGMGRDIADVLIIDHHAPPDTLPDGWRFQGEVLGANTTMLVEAIATRLIPITRVEATLMLAGIYEDTGSLTYAGTTSRDLRAAAWLVDQGGSLDIAGEFLEHPFNAVQQAIYDALQEHAETVEIDGHPIVLSWATSPPDIEEEISTLAHKLRDLMDPSALVILVQIGGNVQLVARSSTDDINVARIARHFDGGGHDRAAAALIHQRKARDVCAELRALLPEFVHPRVKVRDLMSYGVRKVRPETPIDEVYRQMLHTGHEGFPVVAEGRVQGLVTRNAVDRAMQHRWGQQPVHRIMRQGEITVSPDDSAETVRAQMIQSGWGQIPVLRAGKIVGVVTRTDMIRIPPSARESERQQIAHQMEDAFPAPLLALIRRIGELAADQGHTIYFVGGVVRDLLLRQAIFDADLVVEGDAIDLGEHLAQACGGEIRSHRRFGTVKWLLPESIWGEVAPDALPLRPRDRRNLPECIDLVTARTEYYEHPTALPLVERSSIKQDLHRRDFTINTLAIRLDPQRWGELLDFYGGQSDLEQGVVRVLHSLSFVDDPTRILRAARFEVRLGFALDPRSAGLIGDALPLLDRITGGRVRHELDLIFEEARPEAVLDRLQELGALQAIQPHLTCDDWLRARFRQAREAVDFAQWELEAAEGRRFLYWAALCYRLAPEERAALAAHLLMPSEIKGGLHAIPQMREAVARLADTETPAAIVALLDTLAPELLALAWLTVEDESTRRKLERYAETWRHIQPTLTGADLKAMGFKPGPIYREILTALRAARLNGEIASREEEVAVVEGWEE